MLRKVSADGKMPAKAILTAQKEKGAQSISVSTVEGWRIGEVQDFIIFTTNGEDVVPGSVSSWTGIPAANGDITELTLTGGMDILYPIGAVVMPTATSSWANELISMLLVSHNPDGTLRNEAIPEIPDKSITADKIDFTTIPMFSATTSKWEVLPQNQSTIVKYDNVAYDTAKMYDTKTFTAKVPKDGVYHVDARTSIAQTGFFSQYTAYISIFKNGEMIKESARTRGTDNDRHLPRPSLSVDLLLKKNDEINIRAFCSDQRNYGGENAVSDFSMRLVGTI
jgi:C1q domain